MNMRTMLFGVPINSEIKWGSLSLQSLVLDIQDLEERISFGSNLENERKRYSLVRDRIEFLLMFNQLLSDKQAQVLTTELGEEYQTALDVMLGAYPDDSYRIGVGKSIILLNHLVNHSKQFASLARQAGVQDNPAIKERLHFLQQAVRDNLFVVEVVNPSFYSEIEYPARGMARVTSLFKGQEPVDEQEADPYEILDAYSQLRVSDETTKFNRKPKIEITREALQKALNAVISGQETALNLGNFDWGEHDPNDIVTEALHEYVFAQPPRGVRTPLSVPIVYMDGSRADTFPFYAFKNVKKVRGLDKIPVLKVGMISSRHPELDSKVDIYWLRNQEISGKGVGAETDQISYSQSKQLFAQMRGEGDYNIAFYQTGLFPALIGFYRALAEELIFRSNGKYPVLVVTPQYFRGGTEYEPGSTWA